MTYEQIIFIISNSNISLFFFPSPALPSSAAVPSLLFFPYFLMCHRSIYDDQPNAHKHFMEKLDVRIRNHDREIEKMCNFHHQGFVDAITELLKVRADAEKLMVRESELQTERGDSRTVLQPC